MPADTSDTIIPDPQTVRDDVPVTIRDGCHTPRGDTGLRPCVYGHRDGEFVVAVSGDSHAAHWVPALQVVAEANHWRLVTYTKSACPFVSILVALEGRPYHDCLDWNRALRATLTGPDRPDLLVVSSSAYLPVRDGEQVTGGRARELLADGLRQAWGEVAAAGVPVVVIRDIPYPSIDVGECVSMHRHALTRCAVDRSRALSTSGGQAQEQAARNLRGVRLVDLNDAICPAARCAPVIGGVLVYRDSNHLTATYARTLAPRLRAALKGFG